MCFPCRFFIDEKIYYEDITLTQEQFYEKLGADSDISTSQPSPGNVMELWEKVLKEYDEIVCIPMSSGLRQVPVPQQLRLPRSITAGYR